MTPLEIEVKFYLPEPKKIRSRIHATGAVFAHKNREYNIRFENPECGLRDREVLLRLRKAGARATLTYKGPPPETSRDYKVFAEQEVTVSDFDTMAAILESLGFHGEQVYEKHRETWTLDNGTVFCVDCMPFGFFLEIEGRPGAIQQAAKALGLNWEKRILANYLAIFARIKSAFSLDFNDLTFDNFRGENKDFAPLIREFEAGP